jgi:hypothetical protein
MRRVIAAIVAGGSAVAVLSACAATPAQLSATNASNQSSLNPRAELASATRALDNHQALTTVYSLATTPSALSTIAKSNSEALTSDQAAALAAGKITVEELAPAGKTLAQIRKTPDAATTSLTVTSGPTNYFSMRSVGGTIYLQVDLKDVAALTGDPSGYADLTKKAANYPAFVQALVAGQWVALPLAVLNGIESLAHGFLGKQLPTASDLRSARQLIRATIYRHVLVTRASTGVTDHLVIHGRVRPLVADIRTILASQLPALHPRKSRLSPRGVFSADAYVTAGTLSKVTIDLGQFDKLHPFSLPLQATYSQAGAPITAPGGAAKLDLGQLAELFADASSSALTT